jgi:hypothetical protein
MRNRYRKSLLALALLVLLVEPLYLLIGNAWLRGPRLRALLSRDPGSLLVTYASAWTVWPGIVHLRGFRIHQRTRAVEWQATLDSATATISLLRLFRHELVTYGLTGSGVAFRSRQLEEARPKGPRPPGKPDRPWRIELGGVALTGVRAVEVDDYRFLGSARVDSSLDLLPGRSLEVGESRIGIEKGSLAASGRALATDLSGSARAHIEAYDSQRNPGRRFLHFLSGRLTLRGRIDGLALFDRFLEPTRWAQLSGGSGPLTADVRLERGAYAPGTRIVARPREVTADLVGYRATGSGSVEWRVAKEGGEPRGRLSVELAEFRVVRHGEPRPHAVGRGLRVEAASHGLAVDALPTPLSLAIAVPDARVPDFRVYNAFLPAASGLVIRSGSARLRARFAAAAPRWNGDGDLWLNGDRILAAFEETALAGDVRLHSRVRATARPLVFDVTGSELEIDNATVQGSPGPQGPQRTQGSTAGGAWQAKAHLGRATVRPDDRLFLHADLTARMSDPRPLFALFTPTRRRVLTWLEGILKVQGLTATGTVAVGRGVVEVDRLHVEGGKAGMDALLRVAAGTRRGLLYARLGPLAAGMELRGKERSWKLIRARHWFDEQGRAWRPSGR